MISKETFSRPIGYSIYQKDQQNLTIKAFEYFFLSSKTLLSMNSIINGICFVSIYKIRFYLINIYNMDHTFLLKLRHTIIKKI